MQKKINNTGVIRRLGYIYDFLQIPINLPEIKTRNYLKLDPILPKSNKLNAKWNLIINEELGDLERYLKLNSKKTLDLLMYQLAQLKEIMHKTGYSHIFQKWHLKGEH